jgi:hypothetical protein
MFPLKPNLTMSYEKPNWRFMFNHAEMDIEIFEEHTKKLMMFFVDGINAGQDHDKGYLNYEIHGCEQLLDLCRRAYDLGVCGKVYEGNMLPEDINDLYLYSRLEPFIGLYSEEKKLFTTLVNAYSGRIKLCLHAGLPMSEIYQMDAVFDIYFSGIKDLTFTEVAALANMSEKSVRNAFIAFKEKDVVYKNDGTQFIKNAFVSDWLTQRKDYKPIKNLSGMSGYSDDYINVPVATDGSYFSYDCMYKRGGFQIGPKGAEVKVDSFDDALEQLVQMPLAKWRRSNASGNFGLVSAVKWIRVKRSELAGNQ